MTTDGVFSGAAYGSSYGVAHWAHVGGFLFAAVVAVGLRYSGLEHRASTAIQAKVTWTAEPAIVAATDQMEQGKLDESLATLQTYLATPPDSLEAYSLLRHIYWRKNDIPGFQASTVERCRLHLKAHNPDAALQDFEEYVNSGGAPMLRPPGLNREKISPAPSLNTSA